MTAPFAAAESRANQAVMQHLANAELSTPGGSVNVILSRQTQDVFTASRTARWSMTMPAGALDVDVGDTVDVDGTDYKVLDIDPADGVFTVVTLGAAA